MNDRPKYLFRSYKKFDKRFNLAYDMTEEFIRDAIAKPCHWCGANDISMGLDRLDNKIGHIKSNVVQCCVRCNTVRRNMPLEAWTVLAIGMRQATAAGLFGAWIGASSCKSKYPIR